MSDENDEPLVCKLDEAEKEDRRPKAEALFLGKLEGRRETSDGWAFEFPPDDDAFERIFEFVDAERKCCPFFQFDITVESRGGPVWLEIGGSERVKAYVEEHLLTEIDERAQA